jgi:twinkle protein
MQSQEVNDIRGHINENSKTSGQGEGQYKITCPSCQNNRNKNRTDTPFSVNINSETIVYNCHHCGINGAYPIKQGAKMSIVKTPPKKPMKPINLPKETKSDKTAQWLLARGISQEVAEDCGCVLAEKNNLPVIGFSFAEGTNTIAVKWRTANGKKDFWWDNNAVKLWGKQTHREDLPTVESTLVITEGEMDVLAIKEAFKDHSNIEVYSVPNGAPNKVADNKKVDPNEEGRFKYVWNERAKFEGIERIILATDMDESGDALAHELSRRLNKARCYKVDFLGNKDANDLLIETDAKTVRQQVLNAQPVPLHGLNNIDFYDKEFQTLYDQGYPKGVSTGFSQVDSLFNLQTGYLAVITGYPSDGKSAFVDQLCVNVAKNYGWKTNYCSFEKPPTLHAIQLAQCFTGKPFFEGHNARMTQEEKDFSQHFINEHFLFQDYQDGGMPTIERVLEKGADAVMRYGVKILVIDPFNFIQSNYQGLTTDAISEMLTKVQLFCKKFDVLCFFIAHPTKPFVRDGKKNVCTGNDISGSNAWFSKCDTGLTVYRGESNVEIHCWKQRWAWCGKTGMTNLTFDPLSNRYAEEEVLHDDYDWDFE